MQNRPILRPWFLAILVATMMPAWSHSEDKSASSKETKTVRVAGIVLKWVRGEKETNYRRAEVMIREAAKGGAKIVCTTECFLDGYAVADKTIPLDQFRSLGEKIPGGTYFERLRKLADELNIHLIAGMLEAFGEDRFNTAVLISPEGKLIGKYHKQHQGHEADRNRPGKDSTVFETPYGKTGIMICADRRFPEIVKKFCDRGADFLMISSGGMFGSARNDPIVQARSRENRKYIIFVHPAEFLVTGPDGKILEREILGNQLFLEPGQIGKKADKNGVFYFDLPLANQ